MEHTLAEGQPPSPLPVCDKGIPPDRDHGAIGEDGEPVSIAETPHAAPPQKAPTSKKVREKWLVKARGNKLATMWVLTAVSSIVVISCTSWLGIFSGAAGGEHPDARWFILFRLSLPVIILFIYAWTGYDYAESTG